MTTLVEILEEYVEEEVVGGELSGVRAETTLAVIEAARAVEEELAELLHKMGGQSDVYDRLRQALLNLDRELARADGQAEPEPEPAPPPEQKQSAP